MTTDPPTAASNPTAERQQRTRELAAEIVQLWDIDPTVVLDVTITARGEITYTGTPNYRELD